DHGIADVAGAGAILIGYAAHRRAPEENGGPGGERKEARDHEDLGRKEWKGTAETCTTSRQKATTGLADRSRQGHHGQETLHRPPASGPGPRLAPPGARHGELPQEGPGTAKRPRRSAEERASGGSDGRPSGALLDGLFLPGFRAP